MSPYELIAFRASWSQTPLSVVRMSVPFRPRGSSDRRLRGCLLPAPSWPERRGSSGLVAWVLPASEGGSDEGFRHPGEEFDGLVPG